MLGHSASAGPQSAQQLHQARQSSFFGAIKNIVTKPLTWFSPQEDDFEPVNGKRKPLTQPSLDNRPILEPQDGGPPRSKRMRVHSPERASSAYLDPPTNAFPTPSRRHHPSHQHSSSRHTLSPSRRVGKYGSRAISTDPTASVASRRLARDGSPRSISSIPFQDLSISNTPSGNHLSPPTTSSQPFRMRSSLTPQPSRASFGPTIERHDQYDRNESAPPSFSNLSANPIFVRPPHERTGESVRASATLGSIADTRRIKTSLTRQDASTSGDQYSQSSSSNGRARYASPAEKALHELDLYKSPLLPSRLRGAATLPAIIGQPKKNKIVLMQEEEKDRLGKKKPKPNAKKPYAGEGGMKKMMSKRKQEEQDRIDHMENDSSMVDEETPKKPVQSRTFAAPVDSPEVPTLPSRLSESDSSHSAQHDRGSSFRVGRTKSSRSHASSVMLSRPSKNRFSAQEEEPEDDEATLVEKRMLEEAARNAPVFNIPSGFSFAKDKATQQVLQDSSNAKEPPITSLPFSFAKPATPPNSASLFANDGRASAAIGTMPTSSFVSSSLGTASTSGATKEAKRSEAPDSAVSAPPAASSNGVPNFFANTAAFKGALNVAVPATNFSPSNSVSTFADPSKADQAQDTPDAPISFQLPGSASSDAQNTASAFPAPSSGFEASGTMSTPPAAATTNGDATSFQLPPPAAGPSEAKSIFSGFTKPETTGQTKAQDSNPFSTPISQGVPSAPTDTSSKPTSNLFGGPSNSTTSQSALGWSGGTGSGTPATESADKPAVKPAFSFGSTTPAAPSAPATPGFSFGQPPNGTKPPSEVTPTSTGFAFGQSSNNTAAPSTQSSFSFGASSSGNSSGFGSSSSSGSSQPKGTSFSFGTASSAPTAAPFSFGTSAPTSDPKNFPFGQSSNVSQPATPPKTQDDLRMDESPTRDMSDVPSSKPSTGFSFGSSGSSGFGSNGSQASVNPAFDFGSTTSSGFGSTDNRPGTAGSQSTGFSFGQPQSKPSFSFGAPTPAPETPRPSTTGSFSFGSGFSNGGQQQSQGSPFAFGSPKTEAPNPFGQQQQSGSAPSSPAGFNNPAPFSFGGNSSQAQASAPFAFGSSQPASPATPNSALPPNGGGFGGFGGAPSTPTGGGALFTIGAAPTNAPPGGRSIKKLPNRRATQGKR